jgi:hypothetical protein
VLLLAAHLPTLALASVTYEFHVTNYPDDLFHQPFRAELVFSASDVAAGVASINDIESLNIKEGYTLPENGILTMDNLHPNFVNVQFHFSADQSTIASMSASIASP